MADFITSCATLSDLTTWYSGIPSSVPSGDRYIAELAAGNYDVAGTAMTGKTLVSAGQIIIRGAAGARPNATANAARLQSSGCATLRGTFGATNAVGSNVVGGFVLEDIQIDVNQLGSWTFGGGSKLQRVVARNSHTSGSLIANTNTIVVNSIIYSTVNKEAIQLNGGPMDSVTIMTFVDRAALVLNGSTFFALWQNVAVLNLAASPAVDPWPTIPSNWFSASSSNNATSHATTGNCPGTSPLSAVSPSAALTNVSSSAALDATPAGGSALRNAGVVSAANGGTDWYGSTRSGSTPSIGAVETVPSAPSDLSGNVTLDAVAPAGTLADGGASGLSGGVTLDAVAPAGTLGVAPGAYSIPALTNWSGSVQAAVTVPWVTFQRLADGVQVLVLADQVTDGSGNLSGTNAALAAGTTYMACGWNADGSSRFARPVTAT